MPKLQETWQQIRNNQRPGSNWVTCAQYLLKYPKWTPTEIDDFSHINLSILGRAPCK